MQTATYVPSWTGSAGNPVLGAGGTVTGKYVRLHPGMCFGYARINAGGAGFTTGTGTYRLTLPLLISDALNTVSMAVPIGKAYFLDASAVASSTDMTALYDPTIGLMIFRKQDGDTWTSTAPVIPAQNDKLIVNFAYPTKTV